MVQHRDAQGARGRVVEALGHPRELGLRDPSRLVPPGTDGVHPHDEDVLAAIDRLGRLPEPLELGPRPREPRREPAWDVVIARDDEQRQAEAVQQLSGTLVLAPPAAVSEIAACDHELRPQSRRQRPQRLVRFRRLAAADVKIGDVENACEHGRAGYTLADMTEGPEIFDDLYLGLRAGGALRKQRRGEELTVEEEEAIGRWQRLSVWRKSIAIGAFAVGTFGLGFTLGGLIFGRWRKA
jgi:hypothetical protein